MIKGALIKLEPSSKQLWQTTWKYACPGPVAKSTCPGFTNENNFKMMHYFHKVYQLIGIPDLDHHKQLRHPFDNGLPEGTAPEGPIKCRSQKHKLPASSTYYKTLPACCPELDFSLKIAHVNSYLIFINNCPSNATRPNSLRSFALVALRCWVSGWGVGVKLPPHTCKIHHHVGLNMPIPKWPQPAL